MYLEGTRENKTFAERMAFLTAYITPFKQMWPYYWLKVAALRDPEATLWQLRYFSLVGRWNDSKPAREFCDKGSALIAISQLIDAQEAEKILISLQTHGTLELSPDVTAAVKLEPDGTYPTVSYWQERIPFSPLPLPKVLAEPAEAADWWYLYLSEARLDGGGTSNQKKQEAENRIKRAMQDDLDKRVLNDFGQFTSTRLGLGYGGIGLGCSMNDFVYQFALPLAWRIERGIPDRAANTIPLTLYSRPPLKLESLKASTGDIWLPGTEVLEPSIEVSGEEWSVGEMVVPHDCARVWFKFENLGRALPYDLPVPTRAHQAASIMGHIYSKASAREGMEQWKAHLLKKDGALFEIALLNAIARFGIAVLFAGQLPTGGPATAGFDLVALDHPHRRAVLISAKGTENNPSQEDCQKLLDAVEAVQEILQGWYVTGIIASHATNNKLGLAKKRTDLRIWSREDLERLYQADTREAIDPLLWTPPHMQQPIHPLGIVRNYESY